MQFFRRNDQTLYFPNLREDTSGDIADRATVTASLYKSDKVTVATNLDGTAALLDAPLTYDAGKNAYKLLVTELFNPASGSYWLKIFASQDQLEFQEIYSAKVVDRKG